MPISSSPLMWATTISVCRMVCSLWTFMICFPPYNLGPYRTTLGMCRLKPIFGSISGSTIFASWWHWPTVKRTIGKLVFDYGHPPFSKDNFCIKYCKRSLLDFSSYDFCLLYPICQFYIILPTHATSNSQDTFCIPSFYPLYSFGILSVWLDFNRSREVVYAA